MDQEATEHSIPDQNAFLKNENKTTRSKSNFTVLYVNGVNILDIPLYNNNMIWRVIIFNSRVYNT